MDSIKLFPFFFSLLKMQILREEYEFFFFFFLLRQMILVFLFPFDIEDFKSSLDCGQKHFRATMMHHNDD